MRSIMIGILLTCLMGVENLEGMRKQTTADLLRTTQSISGNIDSLDKKINIFKNQNLFTSYLDKDTRTIISSGLSNIEESIRTFKTKQQPTVEALSIIIREFPEIEGNLNAKIKEWEELIKRNKESYNYHKEIIKTIKNIRIKLIEDDKDSESGFSNDEKAMKEYIETTDLNQLIKKELKESIRTHFQNKIDDLPSDSANVGTVLKSKMNQMTSNLRARNEALKEYIIELNKDDDKNGVEFRITLLILLLQRSLPKRSRMQMIFDRKTIVDRLTEIRDNNEKDDEKIKKIDKIINEMKLESGELEKIIDIINKIWPLKYTDINTSMVFSSSSLVDTTERTKKDWYKKQVDSSVINAILDSYQINKSQKTE